MSRKPRLSAALLVAATCAVALSACGGSSGEESAGAASSGEPIPALKPGEKVSITWESYNLQSKQAGADTVRALVKGFEAKHPDIQVTPQAPASPTDSTGSVHREVVAGKAPDVAQLSFDALDFVVDGLKAQPLQDLVGTQALEQHFDAAPAFQDRARKLAELDGKVYGIPYVFSTPVLFYNADLFEKAGLDPDKPPATWDDVLAAGQRIKQRTGADGLNIACFLIGPGGDWCLQGIIRSNGGNVLSPDRKQITWDQAPAVQALAKLQQLNKAGVATDANEQDALEQFSRGKLAMFLQTSVRQAVLIQAAKTAGFDLRAAQLPRYGSRPSVPTNSGSALFILSHDRKKQAAAWELIKYLTGPEAETLISRDIGYLPMRPALMDDPDYLKSWADTQRDVITPNLQQFDRLEPWRAFPGRQYAQIVQALTEATDRIIYRGADPQSTLTKAKEQASSLMPSG